MSQPIMLADVATWDRMKCEDAAMAQRLHWMHYRAGHKLERLSDADALACHDCRKVFCGPATEVAT